MKKILALVLCLMMAALPAAGGLAENAVYTSDTHGFSFEYPEEMMLISPENVEKMMQFAADSNMEGMNKESLEAAISNVKNMDMVMLMTMDGLFNVNAVCQNVGLKLDNDMFMSMLAESMITQYQSMYPDCEVLDKGSIYEAGENAFAAQSLEVTAGGFTLDLVILYGFHDTSMYLLTFTANAAAMEDEAFVDMLNGTVELIASSFKYPEETAE